MREGNALPNQFHSIALVAATERLREKSVSSSVHALSLLSARVSLLSFSGSRIPLHSTTGLGKTAAATHAHPHSFSPRRTAFEGDI